MTIKIPVKAPFGKRTMGGSGFYRVDIATWRKVMAVVRAAISYDECFGEGLFSTADIEAAGHAHAEACEALREHLQRKK